VKSTKAQGVISQLRLELGARKNDLSAMEDKKVELTGQLQQALHELKRFQGIIDAEAEAERVCAETKSERARLLQVAQSRVDGVQSSMVDDSASSGEGLIKKSDRSTISQSERVTYLSRPGPFDQTFLKPRYPPGALSLCRWLPKALG
jgi:hypothetical protein